MLRIPGPTELGRPDGLVLAVEAGRGRQNGTQHRRGDQPATAESHDAHEPLTYL